MTAEPEEAKGYNISTTLEEDVTDAAAAHNILLNLADSVTLRMRAAVYLYQRDDPEQYL